ncbi:MAG: hypothetical protein MR867_02485 [Eubacterium sp.]|nr:hypothetical protein [Eubacterium sp.]MDD7209481.1 hypothetical protein [Lachnospiraceae bacterium]
MAFQGNPVRDKEFYRQKKTVRNPDRMPNMPPATTSERKCTPPITRMAARKKPARKRTIPAGFMRLSHKVAIKNMENTCLLGKECPFVSFLISGVMGSFS